METDITAFKGDYDFLSNFYCAPICLMGHRFLTLEHAFQAMKCADQDGVDDVISKLTPGKAKMVGHDVNMVPDWCAVRVSVMRMLVHVKFTQNPGLGLRLRCTGTRNLIEGNTWHDNFWGICNCPTCSVAGGLNWLGRILMEERGTTV